MIDKTYEVIDTINNSNIKKRLEVLKKEIENSKEAKILIKRFENAKELYEKYNLQKDFIQVKEEMLENNLLKEYIELQNKINMLALQINKRINIITEGIAEKK